MKEKEIIKKQEKSESIVGKLEEAAELMADVNTEELLAQLQKYVEEDPS